MPYSLPISTVPAPLFASINIMVLLDKLHYYYTTMVCMCVSLCVHIKTQSKALYLNMISGGRFRRCSAVFCMYGTEV